ncbi:MAG: MATE family efflux transporter [Clostridia bacterium]|nr:MATE family efflux transporter [Clostridia bacterium]
MKTTFFKKYIGDKAFYKGVLAVAVPMMVQNGITNFVNMLDNIMVGRLGTEAMSGVSIVNQFMFIFNLLIFGAVSAAGIFTAQYFGSGNDTGIRHTFRFKLLICTVSALLGIVAFALLDDELINLFLHESEGTGDLALTLAYGKEYLFVTLIGLVPYALTQAYASTLRETSETVMPMIASLVAVGTNFLLNLLLIFGLFGLPALGVTGAAIATVTSRAVELFVLVIFAHRRSERFTYLKGLYRSLKVPAALVASIFKKGIPIMANELFWAIAMVLRNQAYSVRGLDAVAAQNICSTLFNVFNVVYISLGSSIAIIVGKQLGAGEFDNARDTARKMLAFSVLASGLMAVLLSVSGLFFPYIYDTSAEVRTLATYMMAISALSMPFAAYANAAYFTMRSGGQVFVTILFDSVYMWVVVVPLCMSLAYLTPLGIYPMFAICQLTEGIKSLFGMLLLRRGTWVKRLVSDENEATPSEEKIPQ